MMKGLKESKYKKFDYYLRQCNDCQSLFKSEKRKGKYCPKCKASRIELRITNALAKRGLVRIAFKKVDILIDTINKQKEEKIKNGLDSSIRKSII